MEEGHLAVEGRPHKIRPQSGSRQVLKQAGRKVSKHMQLLRWLRGAKSRRLAIDQRYETYAHDETGVFPKLLDDIEKNIGQYAQFENSVSKNETQDTKKFAREKYFLQCTFEKMPKSKQQLSCRRVVS